MYTHRVQYYETDQMGIVHHSNYIRWFEEAKPVSLKKENAVLHQKILTFIGKDVQDPDKKQDS